MDYETKEVITIGDFNCDWNNLGERTISPQTKRIVDLAQTYQYQQLIKESTRITETSSTLIDNSVLWLPEVLYLSPYSPARIYFTRGEENLWWHAIQISLPC
jgi:hypothetical protein